MRFIRAGLVALLLLLGAVSVWCAARGIGAGGIGWDMGIDTTAAIQVREIPPGATLDQAYEIVYYTSEWYGILVQSLADWLHQFVSGTEGMMSPDVRETYLWQGAVSVGFAVLGAAGLSVALGRAFASALVGAFTWAFLWTIPLFEGMSHVDFKDIPVAAGLSLCSAGLILAVAPRARRVDHWLAPVLASIGVVMTAGTRINAWPLIAVLFCASLLATALWAVGTRAWRPLRRAVLTTVIALAVGIASLWLLSPFARIDLGRWLWDAAVTARATAGYDGLIRTAGTDLWSRDLPWWYIPAWLGAQLPVLSLIVIVAGLITWVWMLIRPAWGVERADVMACSPLAIQAIAIPVLIVAAGSSLYDGLRHVLFVIPALAGFGAILVAVLERGATSRVRGRTRRLCGAALAVVMLAPVLGLYAVVRWFPYGYAFINPIAARDFPERTWELDFWGVTAIEGVQRLQADGQTKVAVAPTDFTSKMVGGATPEAVNAERPREFGFYRFIRGDVEALPPGCSRAFTIERDGLLLGEGAVCLR